MWKMRYVSGAIDDVIRETINLVAGAGILAIVILLVLSLAVYVYNALTWQNIGYKAGLSRELSWMPFIPFASTIYRLKIAGEPWWKMFIFQDTFIYSLLFSWLYSLITGGRAMGLLIFLSIVYLLAVWIYNIYYLYHFFNGFGINPLLALAYMGGAALVLMVMYALIAYTDLFSYKGSGGYTPDVIRHKITPGPYRPIQAATGNVKCLYGAFAGQVFPMQRNEELLIGRDSALAHVIVTGNNSKISRKHCGIRYDEQNFRYMVTDYSTNGTFLEDNRRLVANHPTPMPKGTIIYLGNRENAFQLI